MNHGNNSLFKRIGMRLTHIGILVFFVLMTYFVVISLGQDRESISTDEYQEVKKEQFEPKITSAVDLQNNTTSNESTIEQHEKNSVFKPSNILQLHGSLTLAENSSEDNTDKDTSTFALLQNNPTLGKSIAEENQDEVVGNEGTDEDTESTSNEDPAIEEDTETEVPQEDSTTEKKEENDPTTENLDTQIENDPALDVTIIAQQPSFPYSEKLPIPFEHQEYLYKLCVQYGLEYEKVLAVMEHESKFNPNAIGATSDFGYFQINSINHVWLSETLGTPNAPLDPYVNMQWGTYFLADLIDYWKNQGLTGTALDEAVLSSYNKGKTGFRRTGKATNYIEKVRESYALIQNEYM